MNYLKADKSPIATGTLTRLDRKLALLSAAGWHGGWGFDVVIMKGTNP
jgi:hypothetical protein